MKLDLQIFDSLLEPCFVVNKKLQVVYVNETAATLFGVSARKIVRGLMTIDSLVEFDEEIAALKNLEMINVPSPTKEVIFKTVSDGRWGKVQINFQPLCNEWDEGQEPLWLSFVRDVTLEEKLQKKYQGELNQKESVIHDLEIAKLQLEDYSKNLEAKVEERAKEVISLNKTMKAMLDSLNQGFFIFNCDGICHSVSSKACHQTVECNPTGQHFSDILKTPEHLRADELAWIESLFEGIMPFEDAVSFGPTHYLHSRGRSIELRYYPVVTSERKVEGVVVVATDVTDLVEAQRELEVEKLNARLVINIIKNRRQIQNFIDDCQRIIRHLHAEMGKDVLDRNASDVFRSLHTLKGGSSSLGIMNLSELCHQAESFLRDIRNDESDDVFIPPQIVENWKKVKDLTVQIAAEFDQFINWTEQLIGRNLSRDRILEIPYSQFVRVLGRIDEFFGRESTRQMLIDEILTLPIQDQLKSYHETISYVSGVLQKPMAPIEFLGPPIKVIPEYYQELINSMVHIFRNAVDHGIESVEERRRLGKPDEGKITVTVELRGDTMILKISDDGSGIDPMIIRHKHSEKGVDLSGETDEMVIQKIFSPGFSTKTEVTTISGQGVGMDAVMKAVQELGGRVSATSEVLKGTTINIEVPYVKKLGRLRALAAS